MYRSSLALLLLALPGPSVAQEPGTADAVVCLSSHGASGTVVLTEPGRTLILTASHPFDGAAAGKRIVLDAPDTGSGDRATGPGGIRILARDAAADLAVLELRRGPLPCYCPVARRPPGEHARFASVGYDNMQWPATQRAATILGTSAQTTFTREKPWHGRSGGPLIDLEQGSVVGVVGGYETNGNQRGVYASHTAIVRFWSTVRQGGRGLSNPGVSEGSLRLNPRNPLCPDGNCPLWR